MLKVSIAIVTRNRPESLNRCLKSLRSQNVQPFEVVVSDDSDPEHAHATKDIASRWDCRYIVGPRRGLYANRNRVALACEGTHIRTMDDDHEFPEKHFETIKLIVESDPDSIWIFGEYHEKPTSKSKLYLPIEIQPRGFSKALSNPENTFAISDGATIYPRHIFDRHRYLETYKFGSLYQEFGARLKYLGYQIKYCPTTYIIHHKIPGERSFNDQKMQLKSAFLASYLTYEFYFPSLLKKLECIIYFFIVAVHGSSTNDKELTFRIDDFWQTLKLGGKYEKIFRTEQYEQMV